MSLELLGSGPWILPQYVGLAAMAVKQLVAGDSNMAMACNRNRLAWLCQLCMLCPSLPCPPCAQPIMALIAAGSAGHTLPGTKVLPISSARSMAPCQSYISLRRLARENLQESELTIDIRNMIELPWHWAAASAPEAAFTNLTENVIVRLVRAKLIHMSPLPFVSSCDNSRFWLFGFQEEAETRSTLTPFASCGRLPHRPYAVHPRLPGTTGTTARSRKH